MKKRGSSTRSIRPSIGGVGAGKTSVVKKWDGQKITRRPVPFFDNPFVGHDSLQIMAASVAKAWRS
ncbi:hypothetical protein [Stieleria neptunia]|uniref:hypothetical protein n=1 Tax=Stieleria neptunia TaxID=2527979 RepID=UPI0018D22CD6|nr:hypothetical protein [Stieleria neptunia]